MNEYTIRITNDPNELYRLVQSASDEELLNIINNYLNSHEISDAFKDLINPECLYNDILNAGKNKKSNKVVRQIIGNPTTCPFDNPDDPDNSITKSVRYIQLLLIFDKFKIKEHTPMIVKDKCSSKEREIIKPDFRDEQIVHHALIRIIQNNLTKGMYEYTCASIPNRGIHYAKKYVERCLKDTKNTKYVLKMDIKKFFNNISHRILKKKLKKVIKDKRILKILFEIIDSTPKGLPLGFFTSQWFANYYLQEIDHYIKERILDDCDCNVNRTHRHGAVYYIRYMDDMVIFGPNKRELHKLKERLSYVLETEYKLTIKDNWEVFRFDYINKDGKRCGKCLDFVGFKFYRDKVIIRERIYKNIKKVEKELCKKVKKHQKISVSEACSMLSYYGFIKWSDTDTVYSRYLKPYITLKDLTKIISEEFSQNSK